MALFVSFVSQFCLSKKFVCPFVGLHCGCAPPRVCPFIGRQSSLDPCMLPTPLCGIFDFEGGLALQGMSECPWHPRPALLKFCKLHTGFFFSLKGIVSYL